MKNNNSNFNKNFWEKCLALFLIVSILNISIVQYKRVSAEEGVVEAQTETISVPEPESVPPTEPEPVLEAQAVEDNTEEVPETEAPAEVFGEEIDVANDEAKASEGSLVVTGDSIAGVDLVNDVNNNNVDSTSEILLSSGSLGDDNLDTRTELSSTTDPQISSTSAECIECEEELSIQNENQAVVINDIDIVSTTGNNTSSSTATSTIDTGDAYAGVNVVNMVNSNIVDSNYIMVLFNNPGNWSGDLVLPNINFFQNFLSIFSSKNCSDCAGSQVTNKNQASVLNNVDIQSETGDNTLTGNGIINSGDSFSSANIFNLINQNIFNNSSFSLLIKVFGEWNGNIFNLPEGMMWQNTPDGIVLYNESEGYFSGSNTNIDNSNSAIVENNINISASSGNNVSNGQNNVINTGNAYSGANVVNIINTNIISSNWFTVIGNIFGNWNGNISFGQPDLWVGTVANVEGILDAGSSIVFTSTIKNNGDARASNIIIDINSESSYLKYFEGDRANRITKHIKDLAPGEIVEFKYTGVIDNYIKDGENNISSNIKISSYETDANTQDNNDVITLISAYHTGPTPIIGNQTFASSFPKLSVSKKHTMRNAVVIDGATSTVAGSIVDYTVTIKNTGGSAFNSVLYDLLSDSSGNPINKQYWELGEIAPNEEIFVTYSLEYNASTTPGIYTNSAWVEALEGEYIGDRGSTKKISSNTAFDQINIIANLLPIVQEEILTPLVLGVSTSSIIRDPKESVENFDEIDIAQEQMIEFLGGFCKIDNDNSKENDSGLNSFAETALLGFSFVLVVEKTKRKEEKVDNL
jgi:hypothetical protein